MLGLIWATWHGLADFAGNSDDLGAQWLPYFLVYWVVTLTAYRVLMTIVYTHTRSLLVAMLMHASYTGWQFTLSPGTTGQELLVWQALLAIAFVSIAALMAAREGIARTTLRSGELVSERR